MDKAMRPGENHEDYEPPVIDDVDTADDREFAVVAGTQPSIPERN